MELKFLHYTNIDFIGKRQFFFVVSLLLALAGVASLVLRGGPNYGIDFSGGVLLQVALEKPINMDDLRSTLTAGGLKGIELQSSQSGQRSAVIIRAKKSDLNQDQLSAQVSDLLRQKYPDNRISIERTEYVGPAIGRHLVRQAFLALTFSFIGIIIYVAFRFHSAIWGTAGVLGIVHDVFIVFGIFSIFNKEINLTIVAALLTIAGFSINDTIVVFDRIRENMRLSLKDDFGAIINRSINQTLSRTIITSLTVLMVVLSIFFWGGEVIHDFAFALLIGVVVGCYSSIYVCSPLVYQWESSRRKRLTQLRSPAPKKNSKTV